MADDTNRTDEVAEHLEETGQPMSRRPIVKAMVGAVACGALGYAGYPWIIGEKRDELVAGMKQLWNELQGTSRGSGRRAGDVASARTLPLELDAAGREYEAFLATLNLRHLKPVEMLRPHFKARGNVVNGLPPRELWSNNVPTLRVADELRQRLGVRLLTIVSAYRSPAYNALCPGAATHSYHVQNRALDLVFECAPADVVKAAETLRAEGFFAGGIGRYPGFTHIDTRGSTADWG